MKNLLILGAGGHGKVVGEIADLMNQWDTISFLDDKKTQCLSFPVIGCFSDLDQYVKTLEYDVFVAIGDNNTRLSIIHKLLERNITIPILVHPSAIISEFSELEVGSVFAAGSIVNPGCSIGKGCILNTSSSLDHDCILKDGVHISPGVHVAGTVTIGECSWIGTGTSIRNEIHIGNHVMCGMGSNVVKDIPTGEKVCGNPARKWKE